MHIFAQPVTIGTAFTLFLALMLALGFEFVNGFHDTANAVATVIYTKSLKPVYAVVWSGCWNLVGVLVSTGAVAYGIVTLLPVELVLNVGSGAGFAMVFSLLLSAIIWNLGTWYLGLPASSSHTLVGAIMGVGIANAVASGHGIGAGVNWDQAKSVFITLMISPLVGFGGSALLLLATRAVLKRPELFEPPKEGAAPPGWIRALLILTCTGVSFAHGNNDGQKGMGLIMLIMIGLLPAAFALNLETSQADIAKLVTASHTMSMQFASAAPGAASLDPDAAKAELQGFVKQGGKDSPATFAALAEKTNEIAAELGAVSDFNALSNDDRTRARTNMYLVTGSIAKLDKAKKLGSEADAKAAGAYRKSIEKVTQYIPTWVKFAVALALGLGTMIGWKRIVVTVGEKIGKEHLTYAQGASAELVAMITIMLASQYGLPVSTTHVLSSGIAGTMAANKSGLQTGTLRNIVLAWVLTLPVCVLLGAFIFSASLYAVLNLFGH